MKRFVGFLVVLTACLFASARAESVWVCCADGAGMYVSMWESREGEKFLFLPAYMEGKTLEIQYEGCESIRLGEMEIDSGSQTDALEELTLVTEEGREKLHVMQSRNLPAVHLTTDSGNLDYIHKKKGNREKGSLTIVSPDGSTNYKGEAEYIKGHGNATFVYEKKSYQVKLQDKASVLGMGENKRFVLLANQHENTFLRNRITFELAQAVGLPYTSECRNVDLYINGEYRGNYLLCDKVEVGSGSVAITDSEKAVEEANSELVKRGVTPQAYGSKDYAKSTHKGIAWPKEPEDVTGGYLFELEYSQRYEDETSGVITKLGQPVVVKSPKEMTKGQGKYAAALLNSFERAIFEPDGVDKRSQLHYTEIADFDSLVRKYMIEEISKNYDANKSSQYFYKDSDSVDSFLYAGPVWDYDSAWGNYARKEKPEAASPEGLTVAHGGFKYSWWPALARQEDFAQAVSQTYADTFRPLLCVLTGEEKAPQGCPLCSLDEYAAELSASAEMNFARWDVLNHETRAIKTGETYQENIEYLRGFIAARRTYLDSQWQK